MINQTNTQTELKNIAVNVPFDQDVHDFSYVVPEDGADMPATIDFKDTVGNVKPITAAASLRPRNDGRISVINTEPEHIEADQAGELHALDVRDERRGRAGRFVDRVLFGDHGPIGTRVHYKGERTAVAAAMRRYNDQKEVDKFTRPRG